MTDLTTQLLDKASESIRALLADRASDISDAMAATVLADDDGKALKFPVSIRLTLKPRGTVGDVAVKVSWGVKQKAEADAAVVADDRRQQKLGLEESR